MLARMGAFRRLFQYLGLVYRDDGSWGIGRMRFPQLPGMKQPPPEKDRNES
jgi:hypothetical protein